MAFDVAYIPLHWLRLQCVLKSLHCDFPCINDPDFSEGQIRCAKGDDQPSMHKYNYDPNGQVPYETRPIAGVRRAGMAQPEQVQHASRHLAGASPFSRTLLRRSERSETRELHFPFPGEDTLCMPLEKPLRRMGYRRRLFLAGVYRCDSVRCSCSTDVLRVLQRSANGKEGVREGRRERGAASELQPRRGSSGSGGTEY
ncbi:hypothetical protein NQZ68_021145 [Dissostichus eleginoides]|nr:hypothetical protein NQZ68_021145 [Dissostichus eleginoides]